MVESLRTNDFVMDIAEKYADMLIRICLSYVRNIHDAEDIAHDTFLRLMQKNPVFESDEHCKAWLIRVAINLCKNHLKTAWFTKTVSLKDNIPVFMPAEEYEVISAINKLNAKYRIVIHLYYYEGYSISEIASILGEKVATIGSRLHRARKQLKSRLEEEFDE